MLACEILLNVTARVSSAHAKCVSFWVRTFCVSKHTIPDLKKNKDQNTYVYVCLQWWCRPSRGVFTGCQRCPVNFPEPVLSSLVRTYLSCVGFAAKLGCGVSCLKSSTAVVLNARHTAHDPGLLTLKCTYLMSCSC